VTYEHGGKLEELKTAGVVWLGGVKMRPLIDQLNVEKTSRGLIKVRPTLQLAQHDNVFALGDIACCPPADPTLPGTAQLALQEAHLAAHNIKAFVSGADLDTKHFEELGEALSLGTERAAVEKRSVERWPDRHGSLCIRGVYRRGNTVYVLALVGFSAELSRGRYCRSVWNVSCLQNGHAPCGFASFDLCYLDFDYWTRVACCNSTSSRNTDYTDRNTST
jgi:hypothetical protein